jgi:hypothetical protein
MHRALPGRRQLREAGEVRRRSVFRHVQRLWKLSAGRTMRELVSLRHRVHRRQFMSGWRVVQGCRVPVTARLLVDSAELQHLPVTLRTDPELQVPGSAKNGPGRGFGAVLR